MHRFTCTLASDKYMGWKAFRLSNGIVELFIVPELGGRIIQLRLGPHDFFYVNPHHRGIVYGPKENDFTSGWKNYGGSKVWPAPQGWENDEQWPGPPDPILDGGSYTWRAVDENPKTAAVYLQSLPDEYTGLTFAREIRLFQNQSTVQILHKMRNTSARPVRWAIWQVTQLAAASALVVYAPAQRYRQMFGDKIFHQVKHDHKLGLWSLEYANQVAKFAVEAEHGWLVALRPEERVALVEEFCLFPDRPYPDGAQLEFWVNGAGTFTIHGDRYNTKDDPNGCDPYLETEILSPLVDLDPGQEYSFPVTWHCTAVPRQEVTNVSSCALILEPLTINPGDGQHRVTGEFGLFQAGSVELVIVHRSGKPLETILLGNYTPLEPCRVVQMVKHQNGLGRVSLRLRNPEGILMGTIDESFLPL